MAHNDDTPKSHISEDRPLDALLPGLSGSSGSGKASQEAPTRIDALPVHPRVLEVQLEDGMEWALACWYDPGPKKLREQLERLLEVTLLSEYSQPPKKRMLARRFSAIQLLVFADLSEESRDAIAACGFVPGAYIPDNYAERMEAWREEAKAAGRDVPSAPRTVWKAEITRPAAPMSDKIEKMHEQMIDKLDGEVWGETPGGPSRLMATYMRQFFNTQVTPNRKGLDSFELFLVQETPGRLRWIPPVVFQGLCDFAGVLLQADHGLTCQWGICSPGPGGLAPPPVLRVVQPGGHRHVAIGQLMVQWCVMPRSEDDASLGSRIEDVANGLKL